MIKKKTIVKVVTPENCVNVVKKYKSSELSVKAKANEQRTDIIFIDNKHEIPYICTVLTSEELQFDIIGFQSFVVKMLKQTKAKSLVVVDQGDYTQQQIRKDAEIIIKALVPITTALDVEIIDYILYNENGFYSDSEKNHK